MLWRIELLPRLAYRFPSTTEIYLAIKLSYNHVRSQRRRLFDRHVRRWSCELASDTPSIPIGRPIANTQLYVLDKDREPVPQGVAGELYIGGAGVARGYLNRPELTAERFVANPFHDPDHLGSGERLYRSGDLARWLPGGNLEFLGRNDDQVKLRGYRIELGEIEAQLQRHALVNEAVVVAHADGSDEGTEGTEGTQLIGYITPAVALAEGETLELDPVRGALKAALPEYMVPRVLMVLDRLPLTPNGKVDKRALPAPDGTGLSRTEYVPPQGELEETLAGIWQTLLGVERVGRHDNFFDLGGHSLLIIQLVERLRI